MTTPASNVVRLRARPARVEDASPFAAQLRASDRDELQVAGDPAEVLAEGIRTSAWCRVAEDDGGFVVCWGVQPIGTVLDGAGYCWCATTPRVLRHKRAFLEGSRAWVAMMRAEYSLLAGWCAADYAISQRWLTKWLGFHLGATAEIGGIPFVNFWWGEP